MSDSLLRAKQHQRESNRPSSRVKTAVKHAKFITELGKGNFIAGARIWRDITINKNIPNPKGAIMKERRRRRSRKGGRRRRAPPSLRSFRLPVKRVVMYEKTSGSEHRWYYQIPLSLLTASFTATFEEFKVTSMTVKYVPNNSLNETGLYTSVLLDREGFGSFGAATATRWFQYIGSMPGSVIKPRHSPTTHRWRPTEPSARDWIRGEASSTMILATVYVCNNGKETEELGGLFDIRATLLGRGRYWNAAVSVPPPHTAPNVQTIPPDIDVDDLPPTREKTLSRSSSHMSLIGGFSVL